MPLRIGESSGRCVCVCVLHRFSHVRLLVTPRTVARQAPLSMGFPRQEHWSGLPCLSPGHLPDPGIEPGLSCLRHWQGGSLLPSHLGSPYLWRIPFYFQSWKIQGEKVWNVVGRILVRCESSLKEVLGYCQNPKQDSKSWASIFTMNIFKCINIIGPQYLKQLSDEVI